jgi:hypothetical protein
MTFLTGQTNEISTINSTTAVLTNDQQYTGSYENVSQFKSITIVISSDVASKISGVTVTFSTDNSGSNSIAQSFTYFGGLAASFDFPVIAKYFKINYTNGSPLKIILL